MKPRHAPMSPAASPAHAQRSQAVGARAGEWLAVCLAWGVMASLAGCAGTSTREPQVAAPAATSSSAPEADQASTGRAPLRPAVGRDIATRHALFKVSAFDSLPGWQQDNLGEAWAAFKASCHALERKPSWTVLCAQVRGIQDPKAGRQFLEREFALLTVQNTDRSREGEITGYYEPLLEGRSERDARFAVPVYGVPNDLYILDWKTVPASQRKGLATVRASGHLLVPAPAGDPAAISVDLRRFTLDTLDRRLRVRLQGREGLPYYTRADINRAAGLDAPVLAWVDDPIALYAMQVQGTGRIRLPDGRVLRLAYADQNGHPFKPMQLAATGNERVQTRGGGTGGLGDEIEHFELADQAGDPADRGEQADPAEPAGTVGAPTRRMDDVGEGDAPLTRGTHVPKAPKPPTAAASEQTDGAVSDTVAALLPPAGARRPPNARSAAASTASAPASKASSGSQQVLKDLLGQARPAQGTRPAAQSQAQTPRSRALDSDPSYVFFRLAPDQSNDKGPVGALGVPLTAGRSLAVDPRVLPLGYPVFLDATGDSRRQPPLRRLMFAQDTGGAIRGAVRADYFWGFGADAGRQARRTRHRGRMWVLVPHAEVEALMSSRLVTRGGATGDAARDCLVADEAYCDDAPAADAGMGDGGEPAATPSAAH